MEQLNNLSKRAFDNIDNNSYHIKDVLIGIAIIGGALYAHSKIVSSSKRSRFAKQAQLKKDELLNKKHACFDLYNKLIKPNIESLILSSSATEIRELIINNKLTCVESTLVICYQTYKCNKKLNALLEEHYDIAYQEAIKLDQLIDSKRNASKQEWIDFINSKNLLGIPISIKDLFVMKNSDCTLGLRRLCNQPYHEDGSMIQLIREQGGIPYCKTSVPQLNMLPETCNHIIGYTNNPYNVKHVVGGSTGGDAALIACNASKLGIGSDIGGSLRMPANFSGCIAYKPSSRRSPQTGKGLIDRDTYVNKFGIVASQGPLAMHMDDIIRFIKVLWNNNANKMDPYMAPLGFRNDIFSSKKKLRIGYWKIGDGWFTSSACVQRAVSEVVNVLEKEYDYELIELPFTDGLKVLRCYFSYMGCESNMKEYCRALDDTEDLFYGFKNLKKLQDIPYIIKQLIFKPILLLTAEYRKYKLITKATKLQGDLTLKEFKDICKEMCKFRYEFWKWCDSFGDIDCIVCPTNFFPAPTHDFSANMMPAFTSVFLQNILDCAAGCYGPVTFVRKNECHYNLNDLPDDEKDSYSKNLNGYMKDAYGLPIGVQVFSKPYNDETVLRVMNDLDKYYKQNKVKPPVALVTQTDVMLQ